MASVITQKQQKHRRHDLWIWINKKNCVLCSSKYFTSVCINCFFMRFQSRFSIYVFFLFFYTLNSNTKLTDTNFWIISNCVRQTVRSVWVENVDCSARSWNRGRRTISMKKHPQQQQQPTGRMSDSIRVGWLRIGPVTQCYSNCLLLHFSANEGLQHKYL